VVVGKSLIEKERKKNIEITGKDIFVLERNTSSTDVNPLLSPPDHHYQ